MKGSDTLKVACLIGAGASYALGSRTVKSLDRQGRRQWERPPLLDKLYDRLATRSPEVWSQLSAMFEGENFELAMDKAWHEFEQFALAKSVGEYFASLELHQADSLYSHLVSAFRPHLLQDTVFASLNYDTLFEQAVHSERVQLAVDYGFGHRPPTTNPVSVLKLHGSSNFFLDAPGVVLSETKSFNSGGLIRAPILHVPPKEAQRRYKSTNQASCTPAMSLITPGKPLPVGDDTIVKLRETWQAWLAETDLVILIGVHPVPADEHVWGPIIHSIAEIWYIGGHPEWLAENAPGQTRCLSHSFDADSLQAIRKGLRERSSG